MPSPRGVARRPPVSGGVALGLVLALAGCASEPAKPSNAITGVDSGTVQSSGTTVPARAKASPSNPLAERSFRLVTPPKTQSQRAVVEALQGYLDATMRVEDRAAPVPTPCWYEPSLTGPELFEYYDSGQADRDARHMGELPFDPPADMAAHKDEGPDEGRWWSGLCSADRLLDHLPQEHGRPAGATVRATITWEGSDGSGGPLDPPANPAAGVVQIPVQEIQTVVSP